MLCTGDRVQIKKHTLKVKRWKDKPCKQYPQRSWSDYTNRQNRLCYERQRKTFYNDIRESPLGIH